MKEFSKEKIEIDGKEYTLFLNRQGLVTWEKITKASKKAQDIQDKYANTIIEEDDDTPIEVNDNDNPFDYSKDIQLDEMSEDEKIVRDIYHKFYWIALYENHKLPLNEVRVLFDKAEEDYGIEQLIELAHQMVEDANSNKYGNKELKKLTALHQAK